MELPQGGWPVWTGQVTPFGEEIGVTTPVPGPQPPDGTNMRYKFTGKERDAESGLDNFGARYYGSSMGRWMYPDWSAKEEPVPYAKLDNPQSLNLYSYVGNNPLSTIDSDGHAGCTGMEAAICNAIGNAIMHGVDAGIALNAGSEERRLLGAQQQGEGSASNTKKRTDLASAAGSQYHSTKWNPKGGYSQCNVFVCDMLDKVGLDGPRNANGHAITAGQWANPKFAISGWRVLGAGEAASPGDVAAAAEPGVFENASGHAGIVSDVSNGVPYIVAVGSQRVYRTKASELSR